MMMVLVRLYDKDIVTGLSGQRPVRSFSGFLAA
jgi:hypothetical protein